MRFAELLAIADRIYNLHMTPIEKAHQCGTYNAVNRARQYDEADPRQLLRAVNEAWAKIRNCEKELAKRDLAIAELQNKLARLQFVNIALTAIVTSLAWKGLEYLFQALR